MDDPGRCRPVCEIGAECVGDAQCAPLGGRDDIGVCVLPQSGADCSVLTQDCNEGDACYLVNGGQECFPPSPAMAGEGETCEFANDCAPGLVCVGTSEEDLTCLTPCPTDGSVMCETGQCAPLDGLDGVGVCVE